ncbi:WD40 repeat-like protein [Coccomyxa subellipsoidea C-169]|uniref:WD40 repeat-like protein n=1 Tax=Coccomyxa subellipsoidea (strain C-169) TaxID=574566 RepID=I0YWM5_COCSC|nr:WD40 repeat-like protein [Coccomyxa subellipsoidea C-169]EIE22794.1 WD40 repeat-like protein [Coccomyxa subellipsoidea C-169]|eukprot:XP_005647338.1 WD40 repeat-like protein [Coccomyxa subellipsoidea C-169]
MGNSRLTLIHKKEDAHDDAIWCSTWVPNSSALISGSVDESVKIWTILDEQQPEVMEESHTYVGHTLGVVSVAIDVTGTYAASSALDSFIRIWNLQDNSTKAVIETPPSETWQIKFHPASDTLIVAAAGGSSSKVALWSAEDAEPKGHLGIPVADEKFKKDKFVLSVAFSPDGRRLACGVMDGTIAVFDVPAGKLLNTLTGHHKPVRDVCFTPDSQMLLTACDDMHTHLYDVENAALIEAFSGHESWVLSVDCHPSGTAFATGSSDAKVKLWDLQTRTCSQTVTEHSDQVWSVAWQQDGRRLASASDDKSIGFYNYI